MGGLLEMEFIDKDGSVPLHFGVIVLPFKEIGGTPYQADAPGFTGFFGSIECRSVPVEVQILPLCRCYLNRSESAFKHHGDQGTVPAGHTGGNKCLDLIGCKHFRRLLCLTVKPWSLDLIDLLHV